MPTRNGGTASLPFFSSGATGIAPSRTPFFIPRSCLSPRTFLSCILLTFTLSWLLLYSSSHLSLGLDYTSTRDSEAWLALDHISTPSSQQQQQHPSTKTIRWGNTTLTAHFKCQSTSSVLPSVHGAGYNRETICTVQNLCIDAERGAWIYPSDDSGEFPRINVVAADPGSDAYYRPTVLDHFPASTYRFVNETIFLYGRDPTNGPSWTMNNLLSLHSVMESHGGTRSSWFMRVLGQETKDNDRKKQYRVLDGMEQDLDTYLLAPLGREIVVSSPKGKSLATYQISPPSKTFPTCFAKAVIGLQSRCTRPFCENVIGGSDLTESLRVKALDVLSPSMMRFQKTDPDIVHPLTGENIAIVLQDNMTVLEGESAPRSKIQVALLGRYGNTSIPNANALELSLLARGFSVKTIHLDHPSQISLAQAAQLFKDQSILVAPQGDGLGYSNWMRSGTVVISVLPRFTRSSKIYTDRMMAFGKRFFAWDCQDESCVQPDRDLAHECIEAIQESYAQNLGISAMDFEEFANMKQDFRHRSVAWKAIADCYTRDVSRRINVEELTALVEGLAKDFSFGNFGDRGESQVDKRMLLRRGVPEGNLAEDVEDDDVQDVEENIEHNASEETSSPSDADEGASEEALDKEGVVRIQSEKESDADSYDEERDEEDINMHEYDEQKPPNSNEANPEKQDNTANPNDNTLSPPAQPTTQAEPVPAPAEPKILAPPSSDQLQQENLKPVFDFTEFCKRGRCCGSAKILEHEVVGSTGGKGLTPCAASMSTIVFGAKGVWAVDELVSVQESQSLVWQVDLGRKSSSLRVES